MWEVEEAAEWREAGTPAAPTAAAAVVVAADVVVVVVKGLECVAAQDVCEAHRASFCFAP